jgi:hypothetical protein
MAAWPRRYPFFYPSAAISLVFLAACAGPGQGPAAPAAPSLLAALPEAPAAFGGSFSGTFVDDEQASSPEESGALDFRIRELDGDLDCVPDGGFFNCRGFVAVLMKNPPLDEGTFVSAELKNSGVTGQTTADGSKVLLFPEVGGRTSRCPARQRDDQLRFFDINRNQLAKFRVVWGDDEVEFCQRFED